MKRVSQCLLLIIPILGLALTSAGCGSKNVQDVVLAVNEPGDKKFPIDEYFEVEKTVYVSAEDEYLLSDINNVYIKNDYIYTLDTNHTLSKIDLNSGEIVKQFCQIGRGPQDYLFPICITGDEEYLYLIDLMGKAIHKFDYDLKHSGKIEVEQLPAVSSMFKTKDGFIFYNSFESESIGKFVITDNSGKMVNSFLKLEEKLPETDGPTMKTLYTQELFVSDPDGNILCLNPDANEVYIYDGSDMTKLFRIETDDTFKPAPQMPAAHVRQIFCLNGNVLINYFYNEGDYAYYDKDYNLMADGIGATPDLDVFFSPVCQIGDRLVTVTPTDDTPGAILPGKSIQALIIIHRAK
ncbi:MAG: 6-bladed beta-propeller [Bacteroidaceae bacterium]|nr:6-bladed beta-propeller [Bacteroidaceae bacterium]